MLNVTSEQNPSINIYRLVSLSRIYLFICPFAWLLRLCPQQKFTIKFLVSADSTFEHKFYSMGGLAEGWLEGGEW